MAWGLRVREIPQAEKPLRIAMTSYYMPSSSKIGVGYQVHALANAMIDRGHDVTVITVCPPSDGARYRTMQLRSSGSLRTFAFALDIRKLDLSGYDVLHAHGDDYWLWRHRVPVHLRTMHGSCFAESVRIPGIKEKVRMFALALGETLATLLADLTVVVSPDTRKYMPWVRRVVPNGVDPRVFHPDSTKLAAAPTILFVGTYGNRKRGRLLMDLFLREIRPAVPDARLVMVCSDAPDAAGVTVTGQISDDNLAELYRKAWVFCLPSTYEGFGIPYAEALLSGTPVIATNNPGAKYVLGSGKYGQVVDDADLSPALIDILSNSDSRNRWVKRSLDRAKEFNLLNVIERYEALYQEQLMRSGMTT